MTKKNLTREEVLKTQIEKLQTEKYAIQAEKRSNDNRKLVGRCFKIRNQYSDGKAWWLYRKVVIMDEFGWLTVFSFEETSTGRFEETTETVMHLERWTRIPETAFWTAYAEFKVRMETAANA